EVADAIAQVCSYSMLLARANGAEFSGVLREAVQHVATDEGVAVRVRDMQHKVREAGGAVTAADEIEEFMKQ
ncbi:MAG: hypothetical protein ACXVC1_07900, partial [Tumebacillaceae bacterium]